MPRPASSAGLRLDHRSSKAPQRAAAHQYPVLRFADLGVELHAVNELDGCFLDGLLDALCGRKTTTDVITAADTSNPKSPLSSGFQGLDVLPEQSRGLTLPPRSLAALTCHARIHVRAADWKCQLNNNENTCTKIKCHVTADHCSSEK